MDTVKRIGEKARPVLRLPFKEIPGAYIVVSFKFRTISAAHIDMYTRYQEKFVADNAMMTFFFAGENVGVEWEPQYGPIMTYTRCGPDWVGESLGGNPLKAKEHWFYDYVEDNALAWSQLAVEREQLKEKLSRGDFEGIFGVLRSWAERDES